MLLNLLQRHQPDPWAKARGVKDPTIWSKMGSHPGSESRAKDSASNDNSWRGATVLEEFVKSTQHEQ